MKLCPHCRTPYTDSSLNFCLKDGYRLVDEIPSGFDSQPDTLILPNEMPATESPDDMATPLQDEQLTASVRMLGTKREFVTVDLVITRTGDCYTFELALDSLVRYVIEELVETLNLHRRMPSGELIFYQLYSKTEGKRLDDNLTFRQNGITNGDTLSFHIAAQAG